MEYDWSAGMNTAMLPENSATASSNQVKFQDPRVLRTWEKDNAWLIRLAQNARYLKVGRIRLERAPRRHGKGQR